jgi:hypothetical protein
MSPAQVRSGASGSKLRATRSEAAVAFLSTMVVRTLLRPVMPAQPLTRMMRATRLRDTRNPCRPSQACTRGAP